MIEAKYWTVVDTYAAGETTLTPQLLPVHLHQANDEEFAAAVRLINRKTKEAWLVKEGDLNDKNETIFRLEKLSSPKGDPTMVSRDEIEVGYVRAVIFSKLPKE